MKKKFILLCLIQSFFIGGLWCYIVTCSRQHSRQAQDNSRFEDAVCLDMVCFPVPRKFRDSITYEDTYGAARGNGGHEGCDIMDCNNQPGNIPVISATDGVVTNIGWIFLGGYRIGITSEHDVYYYYAHLDSYAAGICKGAQVRAGELLGFMGSTGEGEERTEGKFPVHLHFGIYKKEDGELKSVNSYPYLLKIDVQ